MVVSRKKFTTVVITNTGKVYDLGAGERVPTSKDTWGRNAFTCLESEVAELKANPPKMAPSRVFTVETDLM